jgi:hypothetical protein
MIVYGSVDAAAGLMSIVLQLKQPNRCAGRSRGQRASDRQRDNKGPLAEKRTGGHHDSLLRLMQRPQIKRGLMTPLVQLMTSCCRPCCAADYATDPATIYEALEHVGLTQAIGETATRRCTSSRVRVQRGG